MKFSLPNSVQTTLFFLGLCLCVSVLRLSAQDKTWFRDVTKEVNLLSAKSGQISSCDINGDGYPDLLLQNLAYDRSMKTRLYLNVENPDSSNPQARIFVDITDSANIYENRDKSVQGRIADTWGMADVNNDGYPDIVTGLFYFNVSTFNDLGDRTEVLLNDGTGRFHLVENSGLPDLSKFPATSFCFLDYNMDGKLDIYIGVFSADHQNNFWIPGFLMKGNGDGTFTDASADAGITDVSEPLYGASVTDWNNDGWQDILTSPYCRTEGTLWKNNGNGTYTNYTQESGYTAKNGMYGNIDGNASLLFPRELCQWEALPYDYDNDGDMDIAQMLVHGGLDAGEGHSPLTINDGAANGYKLHWDLGKFDRPLITNQIAGKKTVQNDTTWSNQYGTFSLPKGATIVYSNNGHLGDQAGSWFDMDNDMLPDFLLSTTGYDAPNDRCYIQHQNANHSFTEIAAKLGLQTTLKESHSSRPFDYDLDGDDDFLIEYAPRTANTNSGRVWLLQNNIGNKNNWVRIRLVAPEGCNKNCIGSRIYVYSGGVCQMRDIQSGVGRWGMMSPFDLNFGLAQNTKIDSIIVRWAAKDFPTTTVYNPKINQLLAIGQLGLVSGLHDTQEEEPVLLYPNPASDWLTARLPENLRRGRMEVYSVSGTHLSTTALDGNAVVRVPVEELAAGYYSLRVVTPQGKTAAMPFIKVR